MQLSKVDHEIILDVLAYSASFELDPEASILVPLVNKIAYRKPLTGTDVATICNALDLFIEESGNATFDHTYLFNRFRNALNRK